MLGETLYTEYFRQSDKQKQIIFYIDNIVYLHIVLNIPLRGGNFRIVKSENKTYEEVNKDILEQGFFVYSKRVLL